jgi:hypothetical protein
MALTRSLSDYRLNWENWLPGDQFRRRYVNLRAVGPENLQSIRVQTRQKSKSDSLLGQYRYLPALIHTVGTGR